MNKIEELKQKTKLLDEAAKAYYKEDKEIMPNFEYDKLYDEVLELEKESGIILAGSPTQKVGYEVLKELPKENHEKKMLSLDKTKSTEELVEWLGDKEGLLSWKIDGLTIVLTYEEGKLIKAVTRGNGEVGEVVTEAAKTFQNIPKQIPSREKIVLRGEAFIKYSDFEEINKNLPEMDAQYKNPRNLCSGTVRQLNTAITAERKVNFNAFALVYLSETSETNTKINSNKNAMNKREEEFIFLNEQGFEVVEYVKVNTKSLEKEILSFKEKIKNYDIPSDGLVLIFDDIEYGKSLGDTSKFPKDAIAFKWEDEVKTTKLIEIEWSPSRTGLINPIAVFEPVELEGTTVSRASIHNLSIVKDLQLGIGDEIQVYKANMIIPQIAENLTRSGNYSEEKEELNLTSLHANKENEIIPKNCPVCNSEVIIKSEGTVETLYCPNPSCPAKKNKLLTLFVHRNVMNIDGISEASIEKFTEKGFISQPADFFNLSKYKEEIVTIEDFGKKSFDNLLAAVEKARVTTPDRFLLSFGISGIGSSNAKTITKYIKKNVSRIKESNSCEIDQLETPKDYLDIFISLSEEELTEIDGIGDVIAKDFVNYFADEKKLQMAENLASELRFQEKSAEANSEKIAARIDGFSGLKNLEGETFVITGSLEKFENREELKELIEAAEGKVVGSVSSKTSNLINNDASSSSGKNKKAKELAVPIITEKEFLEKFSKHKM
ncbi:MAG: NAD-dependent DNA ligase LigA [Anaerovoracaceae bacterium]